MKRYLGKLEYNDNANYILVQDNGSEVNISSILDNVYYSEKNTIEIEIMIGTKLLHSESGLLIRKKNEHGFYSYHIGASFDLDLVLFNQVGQRLEIGLDRGENTYEDEKR